MIVHFACACQRKWAQYDYIKRTLNWGHNRVIMQVVGSARRTLRFSGNCGRSYRGFTLIELIMVIIILGVLAVFAVPRMFDNSAFTGRGLHDETMALLRFGQKTAIAQRRGVCVTVNGTGITMTIFRDNPAPATCATATPAQVQVLTPTFTPKGGTGLSSSTTPFQFTPLGSTDQAAPITLAVANSSPITVAPGTGYIYD